MINLQYPVKLVENYLLVRKIWNKFKNEETITFDDELKYYEAKANLNLKKWEDSNELDRRAMMKVVNIIIAYDGFDDNEFKGLV